MLGLLRASTWECAAWSAPLAARHRLARARSPHPIPVARLEAIPFARFTVECQSRFEQENKGKNRWEPAQPLMDSNETSDEEGGEESDEEEKSKAKE